MVKTVVLWVSRHNPVPAQIEELRKKIGDVEVVQLSGNIPNAEYVVEKARELGAEYIVPVLPLSFIARLAELSKKEGFTVLFSRMKTIATLDSEEEARKLVEEAPDKRTMVSYRDGTTRVFEFDRFEKLVKVELVTEPL